MSSVLPAHVPSRVVYPESDGKPMADNTLQWEWISTIKNGLEVLFQDRPDVFVAGDLLWYPVEGDPKTRIAPDAMVAFGRPKGFRGSYRQWEEGGVPFQVVFEVLSPGNRAPEMIRKHLFYQRFGVMEYYIYDPGDPRDEVRITTLSGWRRTDPAQEFQEIEAMDGWRSPLLEITFRYNPLDDLKLIRPDGRAVESYLELNRRAEQAAQRAEQLAAQLRAAGIEPV